MFWTTVLVLLFSPIFIRAIVVFTASRPRTPLITQPKPDEKGKGKERETDEPEPEVTPAPNVKRKRPPLLVISIFLGSGGHTTEALTLLSALDFNRYHLRKYIISSGDTLSHQKALDLESRKAVPGEPGMTGSFTFTRLPRAREVHQSLLTTPPTALKSLFVAIQHIVLHPIDSQTSEPFADVILLNGPGTCVTVVGAIWVARFFGLPTPRMVYVESFARVKRLSLTGKILKYLVDRFIVQWPELSGRGIEYRGMLV